MTNATLITGHTYHVKEQLKSLGGKWSAAQKGWLVPADKVDEAMALVSDKSPQTKWEGRAKAYNSMSETQKMKFLSCL